MFNYYIIFYRDNISTHVCIKCRKLHEATNTLRFLCNTAIEIYPMVHLDPYESPDLREVMCYHVLNINNSFH